MGTKTTTEVPLQTESSEREEVKEKTVIKEVIREVPSSNGHSNYLIPDSDYSYLTYADIAGFSKSDLRFARNEIYARHGYIFKSEELQNYFNSQYWYYPDSSYDDSDLSTLEKYNVDFIKSYE